jgi:hypothetical protein
MQHTVMLQLKGDRLVVRTDIAALIMKFPITGLNVDAVTFVTSLCLLYWQLELKKTFILVVHLLNSVKTLWLNRV